MDEQIKVTATAARVPVFNGHAEAINLETKEKLTVERTRELLAAAPAVSIKDKPEQAVYPLQTDIDATDDVLVGRIRSDETIDNGLNLWVVANNLRKGAALNTVQIAERLLEG